MISHLVGILEHIDKDHVVIDVGNVGYHVKVPTATLARLPKIGEKVKLFTYQVVREDDLSLFGFMSREERSFFSLLLSVSGVGPKLAMALISGFPLERLVSAIAQAEAGALSSIPGIGRKTAERIILELKEKIAKAYALKPAELGMGMSGDQAIISDSISALISLGYSPREARETIMRLNLKAVNSVEAVIKEALKNLV
jgi:Holliday junction DNA helicase RuvA